MIKLLSEMPTRAPSSTLVILTTTDEQFTVVSSGDGGWLNTDGRCPSVDVQSVIVVIN